VSDGRRKNDGLLLWRWLFTGQCVWGFGSEPTCGRILQV